MTDFDIGDFDNFSGISYPPPKKWRNMKAFIVIVLAAIVGLLLAKYNNPRWNTEHWADSYAMSLCHSEAPTKKALDGWKNEFIMKVDEIQGMYPYKCTVQSLGRDGQLNTGDDIISVDYSHSKPQWIP